MKRIEVVTSKERVSYTSSIRTRQDIVIILLRFMSLLTQINIDDTFPLTKDTLKENEIRIIIKVDKMSRVFLVTDKKIHSFRFPLVIKEINKNYFLSLKGMDINSMIISCMISFFTSLSNFEDFYSYEAMFIEEICQYDLNNDDAKICSEFLGMLLTFELGYLRYDYDDDNKRFDEYKHPKNHIDINYTNQATFKLGLYSDLHCDALENILDIQTDCLFIDRYHRK